MSAAGTRLGALECAAVQALLPSLLDRKEGAPGPVVAHVESCLACQAELARYRRLLRLLHSLAPERDGQFDGALAELFSDWSVAAKRQAIRSALTNRRVAYLSGLVVAIGAAGALGVVAVRHARPAPARAAR